MRKVEAGLISTENLDGRDGIRPADFLQVFNIVNKRDEPRLARFGVVLDVINLNVVAGAIEMKGSCLLGEDSQFGNGRGGKNAVGGSHIVWLGVKAEDWFIIGEAEGVDGFWERSLDAFCVHEVVAILKMFYGLILKERKVKV